MDPISPKTLENKYLKITGFTQNSINYKKYFYYSKKQSYIPIYTTLKIIIYLKIKCIKPFLLTTIDELTLFTHVYIY